LAIFGGRPPDVGVTLSPRRSESPMCTGGYFASASASRSLPSRAFNKDPTDPQWQDAPEYKEWLVWMKKYNSSGNITDTFTVDA
jgi:hypothetical protein